MCGGMMFKTFHEKMGENSRKEIERITFLLVKYTKGLNYDFLDGISYVMAEIGYKKHNYIPKNKDDLFIIGQLSIKYMKIYGMKPEQFIKTLIDCRDYCIKYGYSIDTEQKTLQFKEE
jgi:hypothetical protein